MFPYFAEKSIRRIEPFLPQKVVASPLVRNQRLWLKVTVQNLPGKYCCAWEESLVDGGNKTGAWAIVLSSLTPEVSPDPWTNLSVSWAVVQ